jgi:hypothetical protein
VYVLWVTYFVTFYLTTGSMVLASLWSLKQTWGKQNTFARRIAIGILTTNTCFVLAQCFLELMEESDTTVREYDTYLAFEVSFESLGYLAYTSTSWYFAFRYYSCSEELSYVHKN